MTQAAFPSEAPVRTAPWHLSRKAAFYLLASIVVSFLAGSSVPTPLYALYQARWGFSPIVVTVIFGIYAIAILFATADGLTQLMLARVLQGLAAGAAVAALGAGMIDLDKTLGATANAVAPALGTATGGILAGFMVQYLPAPTHLVYAFLGIVFVLQGIGVLLMRETISPRAGALASLKPQFRLPQAVREPLLLAIPVLVAVWSLASFYGALGPTLVRGLLGSDSPLFGGLALFALAASACLGVLVLQHREARLLMTFGASTLVVGVGLTVWTLPHHSLALFFLGTMIAGVGFGTGFQGAVRSIVPFAAPHERAGVLSIVFIVSYLALGVPAVAAGERLVQHGDILGTAREFGTVVMALALLAVLAMALRTATRRPARARSVLPTG